MDGHARPVWREFGDFANILTLARIVLTPVFVLAFLSERWEWRLFSLAVFGFAAITDWWDGHHARKHQSVTNLGRFLDPLADKLLTIIAMLTFAAMGLVWLPMVVVIFARDFLLTWMRVQATKNGRTFKTLWFAKLKTTVQLTAIITIIALWTLRTLAERFDVYDRLVPDRYLIALFNGLIGITMVLALVSAVPYIARTYGRVPAQVVDRGDG